MMRKVITAAAATTPTAYNEKQEISRVLANPPFLPHFPRPLEAVFLKSYAHHQRLRMRVTLTLGLLLYVLAGLIALEMDPAARGGLWQIRYALTAALIATALVIAFRLKRDTLMQLVYTGAALAAGTAMGVFLDPRFPIYVYPLGILAVLLYLYVISGLRIAYALACAVPLSGLYVAGALITLAPSSAAFQLLIGELLAANLAGICAGFLLEKAARRSFLYGRMVRLMSEEIVELAGVDELTGLANRRRLDDYLTNTWARAERDRVELCLLLVDVDYLQMLNEHLGRPIGDICLRKLGSVLQHYRQRPGDLAARCAGGKFLVVLYGCNGRHGKTIAERLRHDVESLNLMNPASPIGWTVTVSIGVHTVIPTRKLSAESAWMTAETLLHLAKQRGHNRVICDQDANQGNRPDTAQDNSRSDRTVVLPRRVTVG